MIGFCTSARFIDHQTSPAHPERPDRIRAIARAVRMAGLVASPDPFPDFSIDLGHVPTPGFRVMELNEPAPADEKWILQVHSQSYIDRIRAVCDAGGGVLDDGDTPVGSKSFSTALLAIGAVLNSCDAVMSGSVSRAFAAVRPPGHHAEPSRPMGFCLFSNIAIAARYLQRQYGLEKIAIVDFDVHHGNGTQAVFEADPSVLFISLHQHPRTCYPGSGFANETGVGAGEGFTLNIPFMPGATDAAYLAVMADRVIPRLEAFGPQALLISAGFDAHRDDPLAQVDLSDDAFEQMMHLLVQAADRLCGGRIISVLEGGYDLPALGRCVVRHLMGLGYSTNPSGTVTSAGK